MVTKVAPASSRRQILNFVRRDHGENDEGGSGACIRQATENRRSSDPDAGPGMVLDADAITSFAEASADVFNSVNGPCILTPHEDEFARLFDPATAGNPGNIG